MSRWSDFYRNRMNESYRAHVAQKYGFLIDMVSRLGRGANVIAEMGCGAANISHHVAQKVNAHHILTDTCDHMLELARQNIEATDCQLNRFFFHKHDLLSGDYSVVAKHPFFGRTDIIHGHGILEHFGDEEIRHIVAKQLESAKYVLHYVPTNRYSMPSFGDERLMSPADWKRIAGPSYCEVFNDGHDLLLGWRNE